MTTSSRIGEKLLAGWTLLGESCQRTGCAAPLLRSRDGALYCPQHDGEAGAAESSSPATEGGYDSSAHADERLGPFASRAAREPEAVAPTVPEHAQAGVIADYLLRGWKMLGEACPLPGCHAPLMANHRQGDSRKFCPVHALWVLTEAEAKQQSGPLEAVPSMRGAAVLAATAVEAEPEAPVAGPVAAAPEAVVASEAPMASPQSPQAVAGRMIAAEVAAFPSSHPSPNQTALDAVASTMAAAAAQLHAGGLGAAQASALVKLISECAAATAALRAL